MFQVRAEGSAGGRNLIVRLSVVGIESLPSQPWWHYSGRLYVLEICNGIGASKGAAAHCCGWYIREWYAFDWKDGTSERWLMSVLEKVSFSWKNKRLGANV